MKDLTRRRAVFNLRDVQAVQALVGQPYAVGTLGRYGRQAAQAQEQAPPNVLHEGGAISGRHGHGGKTEK